ncbi:AMP-binding protein [Roseovarius rhodophyticola]|uniref:AMP-binding protein n=1 Tax=Roseovarius rhodophyticola TaxID=3080827 RepID=A0ABZ2TKS2_9RHOB|nr:AMP-binding protein [Roseovarius sp. W115]MDV2928992.1 AMP-binding protein [Roseovarius sp. W115]
MLAEKIDQCLQGDRQIAILPDGPLSTTELRKRMSGLEQAISAKSATNAVVAICCKSDRFVIAALSSCLRLGRPALICDPNGTLDETIALLKHSRAAAFVTDGDPNWLADHMPDLLVLDASVTGENTQHPVPTHPSSTALLVATSGTTDRPKIVALSHDNLRAQFSIFQDVYGFDAETRALNLLPLHHVDGIIRGPLLALWFGATLLRPRPFSAQASQVVLDDLAAHDATHMITVPAMLRIMLRAHDPARFSMPHSMQYILCSADYLDADLWHAAEGAFNIPVVNAYGLSEVVCDALIAGPDDATRVVGSIGVARGLTARVLREDGRDCAVGEIGELTIEGGTVMQGYLYDAPATEAVLKEGVFRTGDLVHLDQNGVFVFEGRKKNVVVVGGVTIHPEAVTEVLSALPGVAEAYAFGHRTETGEELLAAVCPLPDASLDLDRVYAECRTRLSPEKQPSRLILLPALPRRASGKVDKAAILDAMPKTKGTSVEQIAANCFGVNVDDISEDSSPFNTAGWDSLAHMNFIEMLEETFDFTVSPEDVAGLFSISDALEIVNQRKG